MIAVSGGVDSMVLLDLLSRQPGVELVVAHYEHGIRPDSDSDRLLVEAAAHRYGLDFIYEHGRLGAKASEATAREARYAFLRRVRSEHQAQAILTAHHQDDLLETVLINLIRGTGRKGLSSLGSGDDIVRPLLDTRKQELYDYAAQRQRQDPHFVWSEDGTNKTDAYLRNYIRHHGLNQLSPAGRRELLRYARTASTINPQIDRLLLEDMNNVAQPDQLRRQWFIMLPYDVSCEVMAAWLRQNAIRQFDRKLIERLVVMAKVAAPGKVVDINTGHLLDIKRTVLHIAPRTLS